MKSNEVHIIESSMNFSIGLQLKKDFSIHAVYTISFDAFRTDFTVSNAIRHAIY